MRANEGDEGRWSRRSPSQEGYLRDRDGGLDERGKNRLLRAGCEGNKDVAAIVRYRSPSNTTTVRPAAGNSSSMLILICRISLSTSGSAQLLLGPCHCQPPAILAIAAPARLASLSRHSHPPSQPRTPLALLPTSFHCPVSRRPPRDFCIRNTKIVWVNTPSAANNTPPQTDVMRDDPPGDQQSPSRHNRRSPTLSDHSRQD